MDQVKIGKFIAQCRRDQGMTQMQLAERLGITDRAVSKWENGRSLPDSSIMLELCSILKISVNDLLCGEVVKMDNYKEKSEELILEIARQKEKGDKHLLMLEIVIGILSMIILLSFTFAASFFNMNDGLRIGLIIAGFVICLVGLGFAIKIEQVAGYYECKHCKHRYVPNFKAVTLAPHMGRTRKMRCPKCGQKSWQKKTISKDER